MNPSVHVRVQHYENCVPNFLVGQRGPPSVQTLKKLELSRFTTFPLYDLDVDFGSAYQALIYQPDT